MCVFLSVCFCLCVSVCAFLYVSSYINIGCKFRELLKNFSHFIATFSAADVDDDLRVGVLGEGLRDTGLACTEGTGDSAGTALDGREETVKYSLACEQEVFAGKFLVHWARFTDRPVVSHANFDSLIVVVKFEQFLLNSVIACWCNPRDTALCLGRDHASVLLEKRVFEDGTVDVASRQNVSNLQLGRRLEFVLLVLVKSRSVHSLGHENRLSILGDFVERSLDTVEDVVQDAGAKLHGQRLPSLLHGVAHSQTGSILVHLDVSLVLIKTNDFSY